MMGRFARAVVCLVLATASGVLLAQQEKPLMAEMRKLRSMPDDERIAATRRLAIEIRELPATPARLGLAESLANLVTEGDPGQETLQEVATTLAQALSQSNPTDSGYMTLAQLVRYEHVRVSSDDPQFAAAMAKLEADDRQRATADFTLTDLDGKSWTLRDLRGHVVLVNFWATWCPPCRKEMPDLDRLYQRFTKDGLIILAISDETADKVKPFLAEHPVSYPILLDPGRKVNDLFRVNGIPKSFVYDREGKLVAQAIDMRTARQFLEMVGAAGLETRRRLGSLPH